MRNEKGFGIVEMLVAVAVFMILTAMVGQGIVTIIQGQHEKNSQAGVTDVMQAEASYKSAYGGYAIGTDLPKLSACPASGAPTAAMSCLTSVAFTNGNPYNQYNFTVSLPSDSGYMVVASPVSPYAGRLTYCGSASDILVHGVVASPPPTITTAADCNALPALSQGQQTTSSLPTVINATSPMAVPPPNIWGNGDTSILSNWVLISTHALTLGPGQYYVTAKTGVLSMSGTGPASGQVACVFSDTAGLIPSPNIPPWIALGEVRMYNPVPNDYYYGDLTLSRTINWTGPGNDTVNLWCTLPDVNAEFDHTSVWIGPTVMNAITIGQVINQ